MSRSDQIGEWRGDSVRANTPLHTTFPAEVGDCWGQPRIRQRFELWADLVEIGV